MDITNARKLSAASKRLIPTSINIRLNSKEVEARVAAADA